MQLDNKITQAKKGAWLSIVTYTLLTILKVLYGWLADSRGLTADGINNATDVISSIAILVALHISMKPVDENHPYGHYRSEFIASLIASFIMFAVSIQVIVTGIQHFYQGQFRQPSESAVIVGIISSVIMFAVFLYNHNLSKRVKSSALKAASYDNLSDALVSLGTVIGIIGVYLGAPMLDTLAAIIIGLLIMKTSIDIFKETAVTLTDGYDEDQLSYIRECIEPIEDIQEIRDIKARSHGMISFIDVTIAVNPNLTVVESHEISDLVESKLKEHLGEVETIVHIEPYYQ
ncbi:MULTISPECIES: cation diffusion facilitator family transporter [unclassified Staphylococcus]|uniref:cation diffusion facilitator family transporter n=1 Tax=unclassified Staphylococcus TaxID=91994 RepID=UPI0021D3B9D2|nr:MULTISPECIES: cation diffusion facilitator family transporter [unclassified Staphylococcus]UXR68939.1 cation diffusion facilitator family transporter [Staphylococcus sp. IVB6246]UXR70996.1 cation diffusion facilitator family transporter [Staphylococcus sp. IVB6240]UXR73224.1 cation diffusion facilitator family transporter [Staphylococcus sp. IVB6238]UXR75522.1 cation diffusion facilitator family transporter [Staphylococcus sp. IVB6233]UXR79724.1 cation diffusion facilitator family transport